MTSTHSMSSVEDGSTPIEPINTRASKSQQIMGTNDLDLVQSHLSHHDMPVANEFHEVDAEQYLRFSPTRKILIVFVLSFCSFLAPISSTSILSGIPEVATTYNTTGSVINASNALYLAFMGVSAPFWGPFSQVWGRRPVRYFRKLYKTFVDSLFPSIDIPRKRLPLLRFQHWNRARPESPVVLHLSHPYCLPRNFLPSSR